MRVLSYEDGRWVARDGLTAAEAKQEEGGESLTWIRAEKASQEDLESLGQAFRLHPLAIQDVQNESQRPKVEAYTDMTFLSIRMPDFKEEAGEIDWEPVGVFLGPDYVITASPETISPLDKVEERLTDKGLAEDDATLSHLVYWIIDTLVDSWFDFIESLEKELDVLETQVLESAEQHELQQIRKIKRLITDTYKTSTPMRDAIIALERDDHPNVDDKTRVYLRHVADRVRRVVERLDHVKDVALITQDTWNATLANEQNTVMKRLTVLAGLLLIPSLFAGIGGMNFADFPAEWSFWWVNGSIIAFIIIGSIYAWRRGLL